MIKLKVPLQEGKFDSKKEKQLSSEELVEELKMAFMVRISSFKAWGTTKRVTIAEQALQQIKSILEEHEKTKGFTKRYIIQKPQVRRISKAFVEKCIKGFPYPNDRIIQKVYWKNITEMLTSLGHEVEK